MSALGRRHPVCNVEDVVDAAADFVDVAVKHTAAGNDQVLKDTEGLSDRLDAVCDACRLIGGHDIGEQEAVGVLQGPRAAVEIADQDVEDRLPVGEIGERSGGVRRRFREDRLEGRDELAVGRSLNAVIGPPEVIRGRIVNDLVEEGCLEGPLNGEAHAHQVDAFEDQLENRRQRANHIGLPRLDIFD